MLIHGPNDEGDPTDAVVRKIIEENPGWIIQCQLRTRDGSIDTPFTLLSTGGVICETEDKTELEVLMPFISAMMMGLHFEDLIDHSGHDHEKCDHAEPPEGPVPQDPLG